MAGAGYKSFTSGDILTASQVNTYLMDQSVMNFATIAARTTALPSPAKGTVTFLADNNRIEVYDGANWRTAYTPGFASAAARNTAFPSPYDGLVTYLTDDDRIEIYDGAAWKIVYLPPTSYVPTVTNATRSSGSLVYSVAGHTMFITGRIVFSAVSGNPTFSLPSGFTTNTTAYATGQYIGTCNLRTGVNQSLGAAGYASATTFNFVAWNATFTYLAVTSVSSTVPGTWASGDSIHVSLQVPLA